MAEIQELVDMMKTLDDQLVSCMRCGMCQAVCPVFAQTGVEGDVARGKLALLDGLAHKMLHDPESVSRITSYNVCYTKLLRSGEAGDRPEFPSARCPV